MGPEWSKLFSRSGAAASLKRSRPFWSCEASLHVHVLFLLACVSVILDSTSLQHWGYKVLSTLLRTKPEMSRADKFTRPPTLVFPVLPLRCLCQNSLLSPNRRFSFLMRKDCLLLSVWSYSLNTLPGSVWAKHTILFGGSAQTLGLFPSEKSELNPVRLHLKLLLLSAVQSYWWSVSWRQRTQGEHLKSSHIRQPFWRSSVVLLQNTFLFC